MTNVEIYSKSWCPFCAMAKALLTTKEIAYAEVDVTSDLEREREMVKRSRRRTVPQIFINGEAIGGYDDLVRLNTIGELDRLLDLADAAWANEVYVVIDRGASAPQRRLGAPPQSVLECQLTKVFATDLPFSDFPLRWDDPLSFGLLLPGPCK